MALFPLQILQQCEDILFSIVVLGCLSQADGTVWRRSMAHVCMIEVTVPKDVTHSAVCLLNLLPSSNCLRPMDIKTTYMTGGKTLLVVLSNSYI